MIDLFELTQFLYNRLDEDNDTARDTINPDRPGTHWQWVADETDTVVATGDIAEAQEHQRISLRTVEHTEFPANPISFACSLPEFVLYADEVNPGAGEHIKRHDPARVLRETEVKRSLLRLHGKIQFRWVGRPLANSKEPYCAHDELSFPCPTIRHLAAIYSDHPDYRQEWAPNE